MTYEYHLRHIKIRDLIRISSDGDNQTNNNSILYRILSQTLDAFPTTWAATEAKDSYLFHINYRMREEWQNTLFYFYCCGRMFKIRRLSDSSGDVSFQEFPRQYEVYRESVMSNFIIAASVYGGYGHGPDGSYIGTLKGLNHKFEANFISDNITPSGL
jgi:hypothetical protein